MKNFKDLLPEQVDEKTTKKYRDLIIDKLENVEFSPFKHLHNSLKIVSAKKSIGYYVSYEIFSESRSSSLNQRPTSEHIGAYTPATNRTNIQEWSYTISPDSEFIDHSVNHVVDDSKYIETCNTCNGSREVDCSKCSGNGRCTSCSGRGENNCECGNGNCTYCHGKGETKCNDKHCANGRCAECAGSGHQNCGKCKGSGRVEVFNVNRANDIKTCNDCGGSGKKQCFYCQGKGIHNSCNGTGSKKCTNCNGTGKHSKCNGTGKLTCSSCNGSGNCKTCTGKGKVTCHTCNGQGNLLYYLMVTANYSNSNESLQITSSIESYNPIKINELSSQNEIVKENIENEFKIEDLTKYFEIIDINNFLVERKKSFGKSNILNERVQIISVPIYTIKYSLNNKEYTSYFIGEQDHYFYLNNPLKDYNEEIEKKINSLISQSDLSNAISLLKEQASRYESIDDIENRDKSSSQIEELKLNIQKDSMKGAFIAQLLFMFFDVFAIYFMVKVCGRNSESGLIFIWLSLPFILARIGFYFKHLVPQTSFRKTDNDELNKYYNGDENHDYYFLDMPILKYARIGGIVGLLVLLFSASGRDGFLSDSIVTATIVYAVFFALSLLSTMMLDLYVNRKLSNGILKLKSKNQRILRSTSLNTIVFSGIGVLVFLISSFFVDDKEVMYMWGGYDYYHGSPNDGLNKFLMFSFITLAIGSIAFLYSNGLVSRFIEKKNLKSKPTNEKIVETPNENKDSQIKENKSVTDNDLASKKSKKGLIIILTVCTLLASAAIYWFFIRVPELRQPEFMEVIDNNTPVAPEVSENVEENAPTDELKTTGGEITATFEYVEMGDYYHLVFKDDKGEEWDFGYGNNNLGGFDFGDDLSNPDLVGKKFLIKWEKKKVSTYDLQGNDYVMDALCINSLELIKQTNNEINTTNFKGSYEGKFGKNKLILVINKVGNKDIIGWNEVNGTKRELTGFYEELEGIYNFTLSEPGDEEWDGVFEFNITPEKPNELKGNWKANNGKIQREFNLIKIE